MERWEEKSLSRIWPNNVRVDPNHVIKLFYHDGNKIYRIVWIVSGISTEYYRRCLYDDTLYFEREFSS